MHRNFAASTEKGINVAPKTVPSNKNVVPTLPSGMNTLAVLKIL